MKPECSAYENWFTSYLLFVYLHLDKKKNKKKPSSEQPFKCINSKILASERSVLACVYVCVCVCVCVNEKIDI